jgi:ubiquinone/menaquinone biosynthesis C-methylase UbiE
MGDVRGKKILDACCGESVSSRQLAQKGALVTAIDLSSQMLELARKKEAQTPLGITYKKLSCSDLSVFPNGTFDVVTSFMALMNCPDYPVALKEFFRVMRAQGNLFFSVLHPCFAIRGFPWAELHTPSENLTLIIKEYFNNTLIEQGFVLKKRPNHNHQMKRYKSFPT